MNYYGDSQLLCCSIFSTAGSFGKGASGTYKHRACTFLQKGLGNVRAQAWYVPETGLGTYEPKCCTFPQRGLGNVQTPAGLRSWERLSGTYENRCLHDSERNFGKVQEQVSYDVLSGEPKESFKANKLELCFLLRSNLFSEVGFCLQK